VTETETLIAPSAVVPHYAVSERFRPGDLVVSTAGSPLLCEVLSVERDGLIRVRGVEWPSGYSALVNAETIRPASGILH
jgi:hypothetical protein